MGSHEIKTCIIVIWGKNVPCQYQIMIMSAHQEEEQMTKLQKSVVSWLKKNVPVKRTKFAHTHVVQYFSAGRALDALMKVVS